MLSVWPTGRWGVGMRAKTKLVYRKWASHFWPSIQNSFSPGGVWFWFWFRVGGLAWVGGSTRSPPLPASPRTRPLAPRALHDPGKPQNQGCVAKRGQRRQAQPRSRQPTHGTPHKRHDPDYYNPYSTVQYSATRSSPNSCTVPEGDAQTEPAAHCWGLCINRERLQSGSQRSAVQMALLLCQAVKPRT